MHHLQKTQKQFGIWDPDANRFSEQLSHREHGL